MSASIEMLLSIPKPLYDQIEQLAQSLKVPLEQLLIRAIETFISEAERQASLEGKSEDGAKAQENDRQINQGDVYWLKIDDAHEGEAPVRHPHVVLQENVFNHSRIHTVVVCALTSNIKRAAIPGSILLEAGEANLPRQSVVEASKISSVEKRQLGEYVGSLSEPRVQQILAALRFLQTSFFER